MSVKLPFDCGAGGRIVRRSCSFTGVNTVTVRHRQSSARSSLRTKISTIKSTKIFTSTPVVQSIWGQQSVQVERVFQVLQKELKDYLESQKRELAFLSSQQRDTVRNSRLAFFYDLEKEIRVLERYIRRLEFQISKVEGLYEEYCIQWRLCQGAVKMKQAFSLSPHSRALKESLLELNRNQRQSLEDMCTMEGELEMLLGELQIKMKGLIGFARLCPGDQYEVLIRLGQQHWRIRGWIQNDDKQLWDEEEMVFAPHIHERFEIKVTELKGLGSILVGMVTCNCTDFYIARPHMMVVDITELGTIKLQLEVVWNPFDTGMVKTLMSSASRQFTCSRKRLSVMHQFQDTDGSFFTGLHEPKGVSLLSYLADSAQALSPLVCERACHTTIIPDLSMDCQSVEDNLLQTPLAECYRTPDIFQQNGVVVTNQEVESVKVKMATHNLIVEEEEECVEEKPKNKSVGIGDFQRRAVAIKVGLAQAQVATTLQEMSFARFAELKHLSLQIQTLNQILKPASKEALDVEEEEEEVLGRFDFLSTDFNTEDMFIDTSFKGNMMTIQEGMSEDILLSSEQQNTGPMEKITESEDRCPLTTGEYTLDQSLEIHLNICLVLLRALRVSNLEYMQHYILEELSHQTEVLEKIMTFSQRKTHNIAETELWSEAPKLKNVIMLWEKCCGSGPAFCCTSDSFLRMLRRQFIHKVKAKLPGQADTVFTQLLKQVHSCSMMVPLAMCTTDLVSLFQLQIYLSHWKVTNFGEHISQMSREVYLSSWLQTPKRIWVLKKLKGRLSELQPMEQTLQLLAKLLIDDSHKVAVLVASCLCKASSNKSFRLKALVYYTWLLTDNDIQVQQQSCLALKCLKAIESAEQVAELCHSEDEVLRNTARETILSFGKKGHKAFQRMDQICAELQDEIYKNLKTEITIF